MDKIILYEELRLIERNESEISVVWKGAQILLFFLAFVFGSFCTFCFHMLMYLFDDKCVLFPKLLSISSVRHSLISEFTPIDKDENLPVDFVSTQWVEKSACYLPTYVPLVSGIFGLVWTTMFLMCSTGSRTLTGLQRPWRVLLPVIIFSLAMGGFCTYTSVVTHSGLQELCVKLGEITGSPSCTYTINVATLAYERRIRGVYQATVLTIATAWLHTACWLLSAFLALTRVLLAVDFQLVRVKAELIGNIDKMMEINEKHIRTVHPDCWINDKDEYAVSNDHLSRSSTRIHFKNSEFNSNENSILESVNDSMSIDNDIIYVATSYEDDSEMSLVPAEQQRLALRSAYRAVPKDKRFIVKMVHDFVDSIEYPDSISTESTSSRTPERLSKTSIKSDDESELTIPRQFGQEKISFKATKKRIKKRKLTEKELKEAEEIAKEVRRMLQEKLNQTILYSSNTSESADKEKQSSVSLTKDGKPLKSNLKNASMQTETASKKKSTKVQIFDSNSSDDESASSGEHDKTTQTQPKQKQD